MSELLSSHTTLRVGGPAGHFYRVGSEAEIIEAIEGAGDHQILILGSGSNVLISDTGFPIFYGWAYVQDGQFAFV